MEKSKKYLYWGLAGIMLLSILIVGMWIVLGIITSKQAYQFRNHLFMEVLTTPIELDEDKQRLEGEFDKFSMTSLKIRYFDLETEDGELLLHLEKKPFLSLLPFTEAFEFTDGPARSSETGKFIEPWQISIAYVGFKAPFFIIGVSVLLCAGIYVMYYGRPIWRGKRKE